MRAIWGASGHPFFTPVANDRKIPRHIRRFCGFDTVFADVLNYSRTGNRVVAIAPKLPVGMMPRYTRITHVEPDPMSTKQMKKLPSVLQLAVPVIASKREELVLSYRANDIGAKTLVAALPVTRGAWVALRYQNFELQDAVLLDPYSPRTVTDHIFALRPPMHLPANYGQHIEMLGLEGWPVYILAQISLDTIHKKTIRDRLPKIKTEAALGAYYMRAESPNLRLAAMLRLHAHDVLGEINGTPVRVAVPPKLLQSHLTSLRFCTVNASWGEKIEIVPAKAALNPKWLEAQLERYQHANTNFKLGGLRLITNMASESVYGTTIWRAPKD